MLGRMGFRTSKRASSVPIEPIRVLDTQAASTARRISNAALDDTDALLAASKRNDRQLLQDISARLANQSLQAPPAGVKRATVTKTSGPKKPPLPPVGRSSTSFYSSRSTLTPSRSAASRYVDYDDDIDVLPPTPITKSVIRASSVPPRPPPTGSKAPGSTTSNVLSEFAPLSTFNGILPTGYRTTYPDGVGYVTAAIENNAAADSNGYVPTRVTDPPGLTPVADLAVRQAHRNLDRIERELKHSTPNGPSATHRYSPKDTSYVEVSSPELVTVRRSYYHPTATNPISSVRIRHASLSPLRGTGDATYHRVVHTRAVSPIRPSELLSFVSSSPLPTRPPTVIHRQVSTSVTPKRISELDLHSLPSRSYRTGSLPPASPLFTVAGAAGSNVNRTSVKRNADLEIAPISHPSLSVKPKMSDTRRKVREVLCKVKNDPHYFD